ncbi:beaten path IIb [Carabus blaptoides fortunei]
MSVRDTEYFVSPTSGLRSVHLSVPRAVRAGHSVTLGCNYDLEKAPLYSVKWYRGMDEFYRYVPKEEPPTRVFPLPGLKVDMVLRCWLLGAVALCTGSSHC